MRVGVRTFAKQRLSMLKSPVLFICTFVVTLLLLSCEETPTETALQQAIYRDPHSFARAWEAKVDHLSLDLKVDFERELLKGTAVLRIDRIENAKTLHLDTRNLNIQSISISDDSLHLRPISIQVGRVDSILGEELLVPLEEKTRFVHIRYETNPGADALQFLPPGLTTGSGPFLLTQSQAINARTWVPIQDSPGIRFTYDAKIEVPAHLLALMSATNPQETNATGIYHFQMDQPIPAYLLALNVGDLEFRSLGSRVGVYAEPAVIEAAAYEFAELSKMMEIAEQLYGPYRWERYDVVVQPPSFPFGGMENPRLTFATPTILAGDRSLVSLVAHELAHSWSGNLVTNATWNDFWLNEGFTVYFEYRIMEALKGRDYSEMLARISYEDLVEEVQSLPQGSPDTRLALNLTGRNPDNIPAIPYDKGYYFLRYVEELVGRAAFDTFLVDYFNRNAFQTMTTETFLGQMDEHLWSAHPEAKDSIDIETWIYGTGIPQDLPASQSTRFAAVAAATEAWLNGTPADSLDTKNWSSHEWLHMIRSLPEGMTTEDLSKLDKAFALTTRTNSEVQCRWFAKSLEVGYEPAYPYIRDFLQTVGRKKFLKPLYMTMMKTEAGQQMAKEIYAEARPHYHPIAVYAIDPIVDFKEGDI